MLRTLVGHTSNVKSLAFAPDGQTLLSASQDIEVRRWQVQDGKRLVTMEQREEDVQGIILSPDGRMLAEAYSDGSGKLWQVP